MSIPAPSPQAMTAPALGGQLRLHLEQAPPHTLQSSRQDWLARLAPGRPARQLPQLAGQLFSLCGQAQRLCAELALGAARGQAEAAPPAAAQALRDETLREHLRRVLLDWPLQLGPLSADDAAEAATALTGCPLFGATATPRALGAADDRAHTALHTALPTTLHAWLHALLGQPAADWLAGWEADPAAWARDWAAQRRSWLARLLHSARGRIDQPLPACPALPWPDAAGLRELARALGERPGFSARPAWRNAGAETGPWSRHHQRDATVFNTPWLRLLARLAEAVRLALPDDAGRCGRAWLATAALGLAPGLGVAAVEMARGLLLHRVRLHGDGEAAVVGDCQVLAPTEWNFHPLGSVALGLQALGAAGPGFARQAVPALMCAYDPCVTYETVEPHHA